MFVQLHKPMVFQPAKTGWPNYLYKLPLNAISSESFSFTVKIISPLDSEDIEQESQQRKDALPLSVSLLQLLATFQSKLSVLIEQISVMSDSDCHTTNVLHVGHESDEHSDCVTCLDLAHTEAALTETDCFHCESMSLATLHFLYTCRTHLSVKVSPPLMLSSLSPPRSLGGRNSKKQEGPARLYPAPTSSRYIFILCSPTVRCPDRTC